MMKNLFRLLIAAILVVFGDSARAQFLQALSSFGGGDGWLAPGELGFNGVEATVRGIAYHWPSNRLIVVDRAGGLNVRLLSGETGSQVGALETTGITGGNFFGNMVGVADDGHVYMGNLSTSATSNFKIYRWESSEVFSPTSAPTVAYNALTGRTRTGDSFAVTGSGANTRIVAAGGSNAGQHFAHFTTGDGLNFSSTNPGVNEVPNGAFRLGLDFDDAGNVIGKQTGLLGFSVAESGGIANSFSFTDERETALAFYAPMSLLATVQFGSVPIPDGSSPGDVGLINTVRLYDASDIDNLLLLDSKNLTSIAISNGNGVGALSFGLGPDGGLRLYALNANNGIQAFQVVPEPSAGLLAVVSGLAFLVRRRRNS